MSLAITIAVLAINRGAINWTQFTFFISPQPYTIRSGYSLRLPEHPDQAPEKYPADALMSSLAQKGYAHEDALEAAFIKQGLNVVKIYGEWSDEKYANTL